MATTTRTRTTAKAATTAKANPTITHGPAGTILVGAPFIVPGHGRLSVYLRRTDRNPEGLGWTYDRDLGGHVMDGSTGKTTANSTRIRECVELLAGLGITADVKLTTAKAKATTAKATTATTAKATTARTRTTAKAKATTAPTLAETMAATLAAAGLDADTIAAAIAGATRDATTAKHATTDRPEYSTTRTRTTAKAKATTAKATTRAKATTAKAKAKAKAPAKVTVGTDTDGDRVYTLAAGSRVRAIAKAVRKAIAADRRAAGVCAGADWHVYADTDARTLTVERVAEDGRAAGSEVDALVLAAIA